MGKLGKRGREQLLDLGVEDEWRREQIRGEKTGKRGKNNRGNNYSIQLWRMSEEDSKLGWGKTGNG